MIVFCKYTDNAVLVYNTCDMNTKTKTIVYISICVALICICSQLCIQFGTIPITLQTFAIFFALIILKKKNACICLIVYLALGAIGLPVYSRFQGGFGTLLGPTGGFLLGFIPAVLVAGLLLEKCKQSKIVQIISLLVGNLVLYVIGILWYALVYSKSFNLETLVLAFTLCVLPFIIPDVIKILLAIYVGGIVKKHVN